MSHIEKGPFWQPQLFIKTLPPCRKTSPHLLAILPSYTFHSTLSHGAWRRFFLCAGNSVWKGHEVLVASIWLTSQSELKITHFSAGAATGQYKSTEKASKWHLCPRCHSPQMLRLPVKIVTFVVAQEFEGKMEAFQSWSHLLWRRLQVVLFMNNQGVCLHFAHKWFL